jgi:preprotein translocase SecE subunit
MATAKKEQPEKKPKRRLRAAPTLREQTTTSETKSDKPSRFKRVIRLVLLAPLRFIGKLIGRAAKAIAASPVGKTTVKVVKSKPFAPVRFIFRILGKLLFVSYFKGSWHELRQVIWPTARTTWHLTGAVLVFGIFFGLLVAGLDFVFEKAFREVLLGK